MKKKLILLLFVISIIGERPVVSQTKFTPAQYIDLFAVTAVREMEKSGIPASITLAQGLLESDNGNSPLATTANNHFGIKCHKEWTGDTYYQDDDEKNECFRYYQTAAQSYDDHTNFLKTRSRYEFLFSFSNTDYVSWANGLKQAGYATNPQYPTLLINLINRYDLGKYDKLQSKDLIVAKEVVPPPTIPTAIAPPQKTNNINQKPFDEEIVVETQPFYNEVFLLNNIKTVKAKKDDTPMGIAIKYNVPLNYLYKYNDMHEGEYLVEGQNIFIQPKRNKGYAKQHIVNKGESMYEISQKYGLKLAELYKKNKLELGLEVYPGQLISLREEKEIAPESMTYEKYLLLQKSPGAQIKEENKSTETIRESRVNNPTLSLDQIQKSIDQKLTENANTPQEGRKDSAITATSTDPANPEQKEMSTINQAQKVEANQTAIPPQKTAILSHQVKTGDTLYNISKRYGVSVSDIIEWNNIQNNSIRLGQTLTIGK